MSGNVGSLRRERLRTAWTDKRSYATTLLTLFIDTYGSEALTWDSRTIQMEIEDDFNVQLPRPALDRLMAGIALLTTDDFFKSLPDFINLCNILSGDVYDPANWNPADAGEIAWGVTEALLIYPPDEDEPFTDEIRAYIGVMLDAEGIITPPDILRLALRGDIAAQVNADFSDDPEMFAAIYEVEAEKTSAINALVRDSLADLAGQLEALPLQTGSARGVVHTMLRHLNEQEKD